MLSLYYLRTECLENPIGLDLINPRFGWKIKSDGQNVMQKAYQIQVSDEEDFKKVKWDSGKIESEESQWVTYEGQTLTSMTPFYWRVKVWSSKEESEFSDLAYFETGLLELSDWKGKWIEPEEEADAKTNRPAPYIRKEFRVKNGLVKARAYLTSKGQYRFYINGEEGTDQLFNPGCTVYNKRHQYQTYDITGLLEFGANALGIIIGDGWWRGGANKKNYGENVAFLGQLVLSYEDGSNEIIECDSSFVTSTGPILQSDLKDGVIYDARKEMEGWNKPGFDDSCWKKVKETDDSMDALIGTRSVPMKRGERFQAKVIRTPNGETVLDFGQIIAGWVEMKITAKAGEEIDLIHGETLDKEGNFTVQHLAVFPEPLVNFQEVHYIAKGKGEEFFEPYFAVFGFRYVLLKKYPGEVKPENFTAVAIYSQTERDGSFHCSNPMINQLLANAIWSQKGNFLDIPTDCPQRERAGWTGDAQVFIKTATCLINAYPFFVKWMADVDADQYSSGIIPNFVPNIGHNPKKGNNSDIPKEFAAMFKPDGSMIIEGSAGWGDAAVIIPWTLYLCYGDKKVLKEQYGMAKAWVEYVIASARKANPVYADMPAYKNSTDGEMDADYIWDTCFHWGECQDIESGEIDQNSLMADRMQNGEPRVATAYYAYSTRLLSEIAGALALKEDQKKYSEISEKVKRAYNKYLIGEDGMVENGKEAPNVRTLAFDLANKDKHGKVAESLAKLVKANEYSLVTGFLSTPFILHVLVENGYIEEAYRMLEKETYPSWIYPITKGATTIWERISSISPEGELSGSLNHYAYGSACDFFFSGIAGIKPVFDKPGYKYFIIKPTPGGSLTHARANYESLYGSIESGWEKDSRGITYKWTIPANTSAQILLSADESALQKINSIFADAEYKDGRIVLNLGSGNYELTI